jgi:hypothetical protein
MQGVSGLLFPNHSIHSIHKLTCTLIYSIQIGSGTWLCSKLVSECLQNSLVTTMSVTTLQCQLLHYNVSYYDVSDYYDAWQILHGMGL